MSGREEAFVLSLAEIRRGDVGKVGGKNASLGEMIGTLKEAGVRVPGGFATTAAAYWRFIEANRLHDKITGEIGKLKKDLSNLAEIGGAIRALILGGSFPPEVEGAIRQAYRDMRVGGTGTVAVRSSATAEDLPEASFAGQLETYVRFGSLTDIRERIRDVRFTPNSGHAQRRNRCQLSANAARMLSNAIVLTG